ncbi:methyl-accepting chemotaxis protein [Falsiroseomonas bella]|uniref:Methyl-accepting chemotaxis protein n=1 Tax=Falsiroseomonas bella TaxID=2184016 RepID=A0A317FMM0_9PROT|nr:HAMP domain-containing methyl-accepting chemotaxis protein [Falsiroseomonas bella]PWS38866.1 methyl-accepting chemotaxis protein [Falsiroseomonas bella]
MSFLLNLSVARKLGLSAALAISLLIGLVALVWSQSGQVLRAQHDQARTSRVLDRIEQGADLLRGLAERELELLLTADAAGQAPARERLLRQLGQGLSDVETAVRNFGDAAMTDQAAPLRERGEAYRAAITALADERARLIATRDERLFGQAAEYDSAFEVVNGSIAFDIPPEALEDVRQRIMTVHGAVNDVSLGVQRLLATGEEAQIRRVRRGIAQVRVHGRGLAAIQEGPERLREEFARLSQRAVALAEAAEGVLNAGEAVTKIRAERVEPARTALLQSLEPLAETAWQVSSARQASVTLAAEQMREATLLAGLAVAGLLLLSAVLVGRWVGAPLRRLAAAMGAIAEGRTDTAVTDRARRDEIGAIAQALETLRGTVRHAFAQSQMIEQMPTAVMSVDPKDEFRIGYMNPASHALLGKLPGLPCRPEEMLGRSFDMFHRNPAHPRSIVGDPSRLPHTATIRMGEEVLALRVSAIRDAAGEFVSAMLTWDVITQRARLADTFERDIGAVVEAVASSAERLQASARGLSATAATAGSEASAVAEAGSRAHGDVQSVAAAAEEMAASVTEIARRVGEAAEVASRAVAEARATDATVQGLSEAAARIGDVVKLIGDIAGQTNLLALNATIEAARAGEAGKGFAVVASEVKQLASQTARATEEIGRQIAEMQAATGQAVAAIRGIGATVERTSDIATQIAAAVEEQGAATQEIARSAAQVAEATQLVAGRIAGVRGAAESTGQSAEAMREDSGALAGQAAALRDKSAGFLRAVRSM